MTMVPPAGGPATVIPPNVLQFLDSLIGHFVSSGTPPPDGQSPAPPPVTATGQDGASSQIPSLGNASLPDGMPEAQVSLPPQASDTPPAMDPTQVDPNALAPTDQPYPMAATDGNLFPTDALTVTGQDMADAAGANPAVPADPSAAMSSVGKALSGVKTPAGPGYQQPSAPSIPQTKLLDSNLFALLQAAGLSQPQSAAKPGLNLGARLA